MAHERRDTRGDFKGASHKKLISGTLTNHGDDLQLYHDEVPSEHVSRDRYTDQGRSESGSVQLYEKRSPSNYPTYGISNARDDDCSRGSDIPRYSREVEYEADGDPQAYRRGSITSIGSSENIAAKKIKQAEYAQYLVNQIQAREQKGDGSRFGHSAPRKISYGNRSDAGYPTTEETFDRNLALTDKEGRYGTDPQQYPPSNDQDRYKRSIADELFGGQEGMERLQHYSREQLFENEMSKQQQRQTHQSHFRGRMVQEEELLQHQKVLISNTSSHNSPGHNSSGLGRYVEADVTDSRPRQDNVRGTGPTLSTAADNRRAEIISKKAKQAEYAQSLLNQQQYRKQQEQQHHLSKANLSTTDTHDDSSYRNNPYNQNRRTDEAMSDKELKRAKQLEYAQALELQRMQQQQSPSSSSSAGSRSRRSYSPLSSKYASTKESIPFNLDDTAIASHRDRDRDRDRGGRLTGHDRTGRLEEGWTIGPLGQPVRKTLEVGHRGVQKAFNQSLNHYEAYSTQREESGGGGGEDNLSELLNGRLKPFEGGTPVAHEQYLQGRGQQQKQEYSYTDDGSFSPSTQYRLIDDARGGGGGGGGLRDTLGLPKAHTFEPRTALDADVVDERKLKAKVMQSEQARALQQQMKDKAARAAAEKVKVEMDDLRESSRLEMERISMIKAYERDQQVDKKNAVDENKSALLYQAEEKKRRKEIEERKEAERERIDEKKMQDERELVRRRELDEVERERNHNLRLRSPVVRKGVGEEGSKYDGVSRAEEAFHAQSSRGSEMIESFTDMKRHPAGYTTRPTPSPFLLSQRDDLHDSSNRREKSKDKELFEKSMRGTSQTESPGVNAWNADGRYDESEFDTTYRDVSRDKEGRRADRNRDSNGSNSHSNSDGNGYFAQDKRVGNERERGGEKEMNESIVYPHQASSSDASYSRNVPTSIAWDREIESNRDRQNDKYKERERERDRDRDYRGSDRGGEGGRGGQGRSHASSSSSFSSYGNMKDDEVSKLDQTLVSDSRFVFPDGTSFASPQGVDTSELMQYSQFTTAAQMPNKQNGTDVDQGTGSGTDQKLSKWGNVEDFNGVDDGREVDRNINRINDSRNRDKDRDKDRDRGIVAGEVRAVDNDDSAELLSYFEGMYTTKKKRTSTCTDKGTSGPGPVVSRPLSILEESRITAEHYSLPRARVGRTVDSETASGVTKPLKDMAEAYPSRNREREREREGYGNGNGVLGKGARSSSSSGRNDYNYRHGEGYSQSLAQPQPQLTRIMSGRSSGKEIERELTSPSKYHDDFEDEDEEDDNEIPEVDEDEEEEKEEEEDHVIEAVTRRKR